MKTIGIIAGILGISAILGWIVVQTLSGSNNEESAYNMHPSNFEKPDLENTIKINSETEKDSDTLDLTDLLSGDDPEKG